MRALPERVTAAQKATKKMLTILNDYELTDFDVRMLASHSVSWSDSRLLHRLLLLSDAIEAEIELALTREATSRGRVLSDAQLRSAMDELRTRG